MMETDRHKKMSDKPSRKKSKHHEGRPPAAKKPREQTPPEQHQEELPFVPTYLRLHRIQQNLDCSYRPPFASSSSVASSYGLIDNYLSNLHSPSLFTTDNK
ncbi:unnamed protein product [Caenorhabditis auriculariae]|uniref:Uncharacterized protein n=1 Tax=Caenorhabditis auriculariae TaxID=2777116 RepID=A0A8S1HEE3_9PELO|nr:unnamed protein product [Caenorhabditis auriculariae]